MFQYEYEGHVLNDLMVKINVVVKVSIYRAFGEVEALSKSVVISIRTYQY